MFATSVERLGRECRRLLLNLGGPHAESIVVLGRKGEEPDPTAPEQVHPGISVEIDGVEELVEDVVDLPELLVRPRQAPGFMAPDQTVQPPMDADSELEVFERVDSGRGSVLIIGI